MVENLKPVSDYMIGSNVVTDREQRDTACMVTHIHTDETHTQRQKTWRWHRVRET
jgi:hypothetical protein